MKRRIALTATRCRNYSQRKHEAANPLADCQAAGNFTPVFTVVRSQGVAVVCATRLIAGFFRSEIYYADRDSLCVGCGPSGRRLGRLGGPMRGGSAVETMYAWHGSQLHDTLARVGYAELFGAESRGIRPVDLKPPPLSGPRVSRIQIASPPLARVPCRSRNCTTELSH